MKVSQALVGGRHIRKMSIRILRDLLMKHELDDRYSEKVENCFALHVRIAIEN